jgi:hypothetical protein
MQVLIVFGYIILGALALVAIGAAFAILAIMFKSLGEALKKPGPFKKDQNGESSNATQ